MLDMSSVIDAGLVLFGVIGILMMGVGTMALSESLRGSGGPRVHAGEAARSAAKEALPLSGAA